MELNTNNAVIARYLRGSNLIARSSAATGMQYHLFDAHGDVTHCGDTEYGFDAFGNQKDMQETDDNPFRYCGEYYDRETEDIYLRARYYDPRTGRFTFEDAAYDGLNWYVYCKNDPVNYCDPIGLNRVTVYGEEAEA